MPHAKTYPSIVDTTFDTPLVKLGRLIPAEHATVLLKLEFFNPFSSVKDRIGRAMIEAAEREGRIGGGATLAEATTGSTGLGREYCRNLAERMAKQTPKAW
jgi:cysteine synthase A